MTLTLNHWPAPLMHEVGQAMFYAGCEWLIANPSEKVKFKVIEDNGQKAPLLNKAAKNLMDVMTEAAEKYLKANKHKTPTTRDLKIWAECVIPSVSAHFEKDGAPKTTPENHPPRYMHELDTWNPNIRNSKRIETVFDGDDAYLSGKIPERIIWQDCVRLKTRKKSLCEVLGQAVQELHRILKEVAPTPSLQQFYRGLEAPHSHGASHHPSCAKPQPSEPS